MKGKYMKKYILILILLVFMACTTESYQLQEAIVIEKYRGVFRIVYVCRLIEFPEYTSYIYDYGFTSFREVGDTLIIPIDELILNDLKELYYIDILPRLKPRDS